MSHHLFINLKSFTYNSISEDADVFFSLYDTREAKQIRYAARRGGVGARTSAALAENPLDRAFLSRSEKFMVRLNKNGGPKNPEKADRLCALFTVA